MLKRDQLAATEFKVSEICRGLGADRCFLLTDSNVACLVPDFLPQAPRLVVAAGEESKSVKGVSDVWDFLVKEEAIRRSVLVNVGGGMITDLGGFAAATFKRGIKCLNLPTTLLAAVDASIGGKTGINFSGLKNEVGVFSLPVAVLPLTSLFDTLPEEEWLSGVGEAIKTALLDSEELFELSTSPEFIVERNPEVVDEVVRRCADFKNKVVEEDFRESGKRKILNLGHTAGHAIEAWMLAAGRHMPHGVAVAYGIRETLRRSRDLPGADSSLFSRYEQILAKYFPPLEMTAEELKDAEKYMLHDKKNVERGKPSWVLLERIGCPRI